MNITVMLQREDFYDILKRTLENYYTERRNQTYLNYCKYRLSGDWVCYERLNIITRRMPVVEHIKYSLAEYNPRGHFLKFIAAKLMVFACFLSGGILAGRSFRLQGKDIENVSFMIWPCNRSIRIFDFKNNKVTSILKSGFPGVMFEKAIEFRTSNDYEFLPPLIERGSFWFTEHILPGKTLARIRDNNIHDRACKLALEYVKRIALKTSREICALNYCEEVEAQIVNKASIAVKQKDIQTREIIHDLTGMAHKWIENNNTEITIALTHGDLQSGNIWVDTSGNQVFLLDWETNAVRSIWYDPATLLCSLRKKSGIKAIYNLRLDRSMLNDILINDVHKDYNPDLVVGIILIENILFYLDDLLSLPSNYGAESFDEVIRMMLASHSSM